MNRLDALDLARGGPAGRSRAGSSSSRSGSTEQHGPHLPLTTDTDIAAGRRLRCRRDATDRLVVAPPLAYGSSGEHQGFAGTLSIGPEATELVLVELGRSATVDFAHVVVVSTHGGNAAPVARAMARLAAEGHGR